MSSILTRIRDAWRKKTRQQPRRGESQDQSGDSAAGADESASSTTWTMSADIGVDVKVTEIRRPTADGLLKRISSLRLARPSHWLMRRPNDAQNNSDAVQCSSSSGGSSSGSSNNSGTSRSQSVSSRGDANSNLAKFKPRSRSVEPTFGRRRRVSHGLRAGLGLPNRLRSFLCWSRSGRTGSDQRNRSDEDKDLSAAEIESLYRPPKESSKAVKQPTPMPATVTVRRHSLSKSADINKDLSKSSKSSSSRSCQSKSPISSNEVKSERGSDRRDELDDQVKDPLAHSAASSGAEESTAAVNTEAEPEAKQMLQQELEVFADLEPEPDVNTEQSNPQPEVKQAETDSTKAHNNRRDEESPFGGSTSFMAGLAFYEANGDGRRDAAPVDLLMADDWSLADERGYQRLFNRRARALIGSSTSAEDAVSDGADAEPCPMLFAEVRATAAEAPSDCRSSLASTEADEQSPESAICLIATLTRMTEGRQQQLVRLGGASLDEPEDCSTG